MLYVEWMAVIVSCLLSSQTVGYDPMIGGEVTSKFGVQLMTLDEVWSRADYITLHTPLIAQTKRESYT